MTPNIQFFELPGIHGRFEITTGTKGHPNRAIARRFPVFFSCETQRDAANMALWIVVSDNGHHECQCFAKFRHAIALVIQT